MIVSKAPALCFTEVSRGFVLKHVTRLPNLNPDRVSRGHPRPPDPSPLKAGMEGVHEQHVVLAQSYFSGLELHKVQGRDHNKGSSQTGDGIRRMLSP